MLTSPNSTLNISSQLHRATRPSDVKYSVGFTACLSEHSCGTELILPTSSDEHLIQLTPNSEHLRCFWEVQFHLLYALGSTLTTPTIASQRIEQKWSLKVPSTLRQVPMKTLHTGRRLNSTASQAKHPGDHVLYLLTITGLTGCSGLLHFR